MLLFFSTAVNYTYILYAELNSKPIIQPTQYLHLYFAGFPQWDFQDGGFITPSWPVVPRTRQDINRGQGGVLTGAKVGYLQGPRWGISKSQGGVVTLAKLGYLHGQI